MLWRLVALSQRMLEGFALAALAQGDEVGARALPGLCGELVDEAGTALRKLARAEPAARRAFLRGALAKPALDPSWSARLARAERHPSPELLAYLAQLSRAR